MCVSFPFRKKSMTKKTNFYSLGDHLQWRQNYSENGTVLAMYMQNDKLFQWKFSKNNTHVHLCCQSACFWRCQSTQWETVNADETTQCSAFFFFFLYRSIFPDHGRDWIYVPVRNSVDCDDRSFAVASNSTKFSFVYSLHKIGVVARRSQIHCPID